MSNQTDFGPISYLERRLKYYQRRHSKFTGYKKSPVKFAKLPNWFQAMLLQDDTLDKVIENMAARVIEYAQAIKILKTQGLMTRIEKGINKNN